MGNTISQLKLLFQNIFETNGEIALASDHNGLTVPREILLEILSWLTVEDLLRCKCVCKQWYALSQDRQFLTMHEGRSKGTHSFHSLKATFVFLYVRDGLFLEQSKLSGEFRIRNPATKQTLALPNPCHASFSMVITFRNSTGTYTVVSLYNGKREGKKGGCEVLSIGCGKKLSWRPLEIPNFANLCKKPEMVSTAFMDEVYHCARFHEDGSAEIVSIDMNKEDFTRLQLPEKTFLPDWRKVRIISWNEKLAVYNFLQHELRVWVLEDYKKQKWADTKIIVPLTFLREDPSIKECYIQYHVHGSILWFRVSYNKILAYCIESKKVVSTICGQEGEEISCFHVPSTITLEGMQAENETKLKET